MDIIFTCTLASTSIIDSLIHFPWGRMFLIGCLIYVILCVYAWIFADRILFPAPKGPSYEKDENVFFLETKRGDQIACKHWIPENPKGLTILYSHGNAEDIGKSRIFYRPG